METIGGTEEIHMQIIPLVVIQEVCGAFSLHDHAVFCIKSEKDKTAHKLVDYAHNIYNDLQHFLNDNVLPGSIVSPVAENFERQWIFAHSETRGNEASAVSPVDLPIVTLATLVSSWNPSEWEVNANDAALRFFLDYILLQLSGIELILETRIKADFEALDTTPSILSITDGVQQHNLTQHLASFFSKKRHTKLENWINIATQSEMGNEGVFCFIAMLLKPCDLFIDTKLERFAYVCQTSSTHKSASEVFKQLRKTLKQKEHETLCREEGSQKRLQNQLAELKRRITQGANVDDIEAEIKINEEEQANCLIQLEICKENIHAYTSKHLEIATLMKGCVINLRSLLKDVKEEKENDNSLFNTDLLLAVEKLLRLKEQKILSCITNHYKDEWESITDESVRTLYNEFIVSAFEKADRKSPLSHIETSTRITQVFLAMNRDVVFTNVSKWNAKISFSKELSLDLFISSKTIEKNIAIEIHPRALDQMCQIANGNVEPDLGLLCEQFGKLENGDIPEKECISSVENVLRPTRMISKLEIYGVVQEMRSALGLQKPEKSRFDSISYAEAYELRMCMRQVSNNHKGLVLKAAQLLADGIKYPDNSRFVECVEIIKLIPSELNDFKAGKCLTPESRTFNQDLLFSIDPAATLTKKKLQNRVFETLSVPSEASKKLKEYVLQRMEELKSYCDPVASMLPFQHPLSAVYHITKHLDSLSSYAPGLIPQGGFASQAEADKLYFQTIPVDHIPGGSNQNQSNLDTSLITQNGESIKRTWLNSEDHFAVTKCDFAPEEPTSAIQPGEQLLSHYKKK